MTPQEIFDTVARHLFTQGHQAFDDAKSMCVYRAPNGDKCAAGCVLPDEYYLPSMETGLGAEELAEDYDVPDWWRENSRLIATLQQVHDAEGFWTSTKVMHSALRVVARAFFLSHIHLSSLSFKDR